MSDREKQNSDLLVDLIQRVSQSKHLEHGCPAKDLVEEINNYLKYNSNAVSYFQPLLEPGFHRLSPFLDNVKIFAMTFNRLKILPIGGDYEPSQAPRQPVANAVKVERPHSAHSRNNVHIPNGFGETNGDLHLQHNEPIRSHRSSGSNSRKSSYRANSSSNSSVVNEPSDVEPKYAESNYTEADSAPTINTSLTEAAKIEDEPHVIKRKAAKQWLFTLIRKFKDDKDGGIRHQKTSLSDTIPLSQVDQLCHQEKGYSNFKSLCQDMGYRNVEHWCLHCASPQIKLAKHKTTGKGATKTGEWVFQEHDKYRGMELICPTTHKIPDKDLLPDIGKLREPLRIADNTTKFKQFPEDEKTEAYCKERRSDVECTVSYLPDSPVLNCFLIRLESDVKLYGNPMDRQIASIYGVAGPVASNPNYLRYKMLPEALRNVQGMEIDQDEASAFFSVEIESKIAIFDIKIDVNRIDIHAKQ